MRSLTSRGLRPLLVVLAVVAAIGLTAATGSARTGVYSWPGAVMLHVHTTPDGSSPGYVQSDPYYLDCPNECDRPYDVGQSITLWAYPTHGFAFSGWTTGPCKDSTVNPCTFTISADTDVTADFSGKFDPSKPKDSSIKTLTVIVDAFCGLCTLPTHSLTSGLSFGAKSSAHATGGCAAPVVMKSSQHTAGVCSGLFALVVSPDESIICFNDGIGICSADYPVGTQVTLFAESCGPFVAWEDTGTNEDPRVVTMDTSKTISAAFLFTGFC